MRKHRQDFDWSQPHSWSLLAGVGLWMLLLSCLVGCTHGANTPNYETSARTALNLLAEVVTPASQMAQKLCAAAEEDALVEMRAQKITPDEAAQRTQTARARCDPLWVTFDAIRELHDQASVLIEDGAFEEAQERLERATQKFRELGAGSAHTPAEAADSD